MAPLRHQIPQFLVALECSSLTPAPFALAANCPTTGPPPLLVPRHGMIAAMFFFSCFFFFLLHARLLLLSRPDLTPAPIFSTISGTAVFGSGGNTFRTFLVAPQRIPGKYLVATPVVSYKSILPLHALVWSVPPTTSVPARKASHQQPRVPPNSSPASLRYIHNPSTLVCLLARPG